MALSQAIQERARGRHALAQSLGWKDILLSVYDNIGKDRIILVAAGVTF
jgi:hypothetical protein